MIKRIFTNREWISKLEAQFIYCPPKSSINSFVSHRFSDAFKSSMDYWNIPIDKKFNQKKGKKMSKKQQIEELEAANTRLWDAYRLLSDRLERYYTDLRKHTDKKVDVLAKTGIFDSVVELSRDSDEYKEEKQKLTDRGLSLVNVTEDGRTELWTKKGE